MDQIPFNLPYLSPGQRERVIDKFDMRYLAGNGKLTKECNAWGANYFGVPKALLTTSCSDALEMAAMLCDFQPGDEVIMPTYTFVSTANAFLRQGATIRFVDSNMDHPNLDVDAVRNRITERTKAIVAVHYGGMACDMDALKRLATEHDLFLIEDAAQAIAATYNGQQLGGIGDFGTLSFHETKNISTGEGGMFLVNRPGLAERAEIIWEKGTNRAAFKRGDVQKYEWLEVGSSFLPSELTAALLLGQIEDLDYIQENRVRIWQRYNEGLKDLEVSGLAELPKVPKGASINGHLFYLVCPDLHTRNDLLNHLHKNGIGAVFHYLLLHESPFFKDKHDGVSMPNAKRFAEGLIRLPLFVELSESDQDYVMEQVRQFFK